MIPAYISYIAGYKYQLAEHYIIKIPITGYEFNHDFCRLSLNGVLAIGAGYAWDGPSGPTFDTKNFMRGSLVHDVLYQAMGLELLPISCKQEADKILRRICREDGMSKIRAWWVYRAVKKFGNPRPSEYKTVVVAP